MWHSICRITAFAVIKAFQYEFDLYVSVSLEAFLYDYYFISILGEGFLAW